MEQPGTPATTPQQAGGVGVEAPEGVDGGDGVAGPPEPRGVPSAPPAVTPDVAETDLPELPDDRYINRELSWLDFNARVLALAEDESQPLLERAKFLAIFASNLDEFYMVRVAGLKRREETGLSVRSADGLTPREQLAYIAKRNQELVEQQSAAWELRLRPILAERGIRIAKWAELTDEQRERLSRYFREQIFPVLTPLAVDPAHPFPYISGLSLNLAVTVRDPTGGGERFARVKVPNNVSRLVPIDHHRDDPDATFMPLEELIAAHLDDLFAGMQVTEVHAFRVTRNADLEVEEDRDEDLLQALERELAQRRFGPPVRLEVADDMSEHMMELLLRELEVDPHDVVVVHGLLDLSCLWQLYGVDAQRPQGPAVRARHASGVRRAGDAQERVRDAARGRRARAPPVRLVLHERAAVHRAGGQRPEGARDQADAVPHLRRLPDRRRADRRGRGRHTGRGAGGDQGALRRAGEHQVGAHAGEGGRARRVRHGGAQDPLQDRARGAPGGFGHPPLLPHRHRQLQPEDRAAVRGHRPADRGAVDRRGPHRPVQRADRLRAAGRVPQPPGGAVRNPPRHRGADRAARSSTCGPAGRPAYASRSTPWWTSRSSTRCTALPRPAWRSTSSCAASARSSRASRGCRRTSGCARSSAASSSTRGCSTSSARTSTGSAART